MTRQKTPKQAAKTMPEITVTATGKGKRRIVLLLSLFILVGLVIGGIYLFRTPPVGCDSYRSIGCEASADNACCD